MSDLISRDAAFDEIIWNSDNGMIDAKVAIEALRKLPSVEPERKTGKWVRGKDGYIRCDKCGSRGSAIKAHYCHHCGAKMEENDEIDD